MSERDFDTLLGSIDRSQHPGNQFFVRLLTDMTAARGTETGPASDLTRWQAANLERPSHLRTMPRWMEMVAAAVVFALLAGIASGIGGHWRGSGGDNVLPINNLPPVQLGGMAAQDYQYSGPAPGSGAWTAVQTIDASTIGTIRDVRLDDEHLYIAFDNLTDPPAIRIQVRDLQTLQIGWDQPIIGTVPWVVTPSGVIAAVPVPSGPYNMLDPSVFAIALLDAETGQVSWRTDEVFDVRERYGSSALAVDGEVVYFSSPSGNLIALNRVTGSEMWRYDWAQDFDPVSTSAPCVETEANVCSSAGAAMPLVAANRGGIYLVDQGALEVSALNPSDGSLTWQTGLPVPGSSHAVLSQVTAVDDGLAFVLGLQGEDTGDQRSLVGVLSTQNGASLWQVQGQLPTLVVSDGSHLYMTEQYENDFRLLSVEAATGKTSWEAPIVGSPIGFLSATHELIIQGTSLYGINVDTHSETWQVSNVSPICWPTFPGNSAGLFAVVCGSSKIEIARVTPERPVTPVAASPESELPIVQSGGTSAQDNQFSGPPPAGGSLEAGWTVFDSEDGAFGSGKVSGDLLVSAEFNQTVYGYSTLRADNLETSELIWEAAITNTVGWAIVPEGIVAAVPAPTASSPFNAMQPVFVLALLDRETGATLWTSQTVYWSALYSPSFLLVDASTVYISWGIGRVDALDISTGNELWYFTWEAKYPSDYGNEPCIGQDAERDWCQANYGFSTSLASGDHLLFVTDSASQIVHAVDSASGAERWSKSIREIAGKRTNLDGLMAVDRGVLFILDDSIGPLGDTVLLVGKLSSSDGSLQWTNADLVQYSTPASNGRELFGSTVQGTNHVVAAIDIDTGTTRVIADTPLTVMGYLTDSNTIIVGAAPYQGLDPNTGEVVWALDLRSSEMCSLVFPGSPDGWFACLDAYGGVSVVRSAR